MTISSFSSFFSPYNKFDRLNEIFFEDITVRWHGKGKFNQACSFLSLTLSVDNQIIHPARCYGLWKRYGGKWETEDDIPFFYKVRGNDIYNISLALSLFAEYCNWK